MKNNDNYGSGGLGVGGVLGLIFIVLKLTGIIDWTWWWVLSPFIIGLVINLIVLIICSIIITKEIRSWDD